MAEINDELHINVATNWAKKRAKQNHEKLRGIDPESAVASEIFRLSGDICRLRGEIRELKKLIESKSSDNPQTVTSWVYGKIDLRKLVQIVEEIELKVKKLETEK